MEDSLMFSREELSDSEDKQSQAESVEKRLLQSGMLRHQLGK